MITIQKHIGCKDFLSYFSTIQMLDSWSTNEDIKGKFLNCESNINENMLWVFLFSYLLKNERKESNTLHNFLMFEVSKHNSKVMPKSSSISLV
jgi:hypothetical protein